MSETPEAGPDSGAEGFAPPDPGFEARPGDGSGSRQGGFGPRPDGGFEVRPDRDGGFAFPTPPYAPPQHFGVRPPPHGYTPQAYPGGYSGYSGYSAYYGPPLPAEPTSGMAITGLVLGVFSLLLFWTPLGPLLAIPGIVFSSIGLSQCSKPGRSGVGLAITGLVCSLVSAVIWVAIATFIAALLF